jgi:hypothetical protein
METVKIIKARYILTILFFLMERKTMMEQSRPNAPFMMNVISINVFINYFNGVDVLI